MFVTRKYMNNFNRVVLPPSKSGNFLKPHNTSNPIVRSEELAIAFRIKRKALILQSKRGIDQSTLGDTCDLDDPTKESEI
jgi:hypothetical protein